MSLFASLPMYDWPEVTAGTEALWIAVRSALGAEGFETPPNLTQPQNQRQHWCDRNMLFSQTCGYPYIMHLTDHVHLLARPSYTVEGCGNGTYRSAIVVRRGSFDQLAQLKGRRLAFNSRDSLSGYRCLSPLMGDLDAHFGEMIASGSHRRSAALVASGTADCAAIDAVCWNMVQRFDPDVAAQLDVIAWGPEFPSLPFITSKTFGLEQVDTLRRALFAGLEIALSDPSFADLNLTGLQEARFEDYAALSAL